MAVQAPPDTTWIRPLAPNPGARLRLFCLPFAGGGTIPFRAWPKALPPHVEALAVCPPGREDRLRERPLESLPPLVAGAARAIRPWLDHRPFVLYGHSLGALVSFELARALRDAAGREPALLAVSSRAAPDAPLPTPLRHLPDDRFVAALRARYDGIPAAVLAEPDLLAIFLPLLRADLAVLETYQYRPAAKLRCPVTVFGGARDPTVTPQALAGWRAHTDGAFRQHTLDGGHFFIQTDAARFLGLLAAELAAL